MIDREACDQGLVKSAARTIRVLDAFAEAKCARRASDLSAALNIPLSSCIAILDTLVAEGVLVFEMGERKYFPTDKVRRLGDWLSQVDVLQLAVVSAARRIHSTLGYAATVSQVAGPCAEFIFAAGQKRWTAGSRPLLGGPEGLVVLSRRSRSEMELAVEVHNHSFGKRRSLSLRDLEKQVCAARVDGYAAGYSASGAGEFSVAFCLGDEGNGRETILCARVDERQFRARSARIVAWIRQCISLSMDAYAYASTPFASVA